MPRAGFELAEEEFAQDGDAVGPVERDGADVKHTGDRSVGTEADQVDRHAEENRDPDGIEGGSGDVVDLGPDAGERKQTVTGEGKNGSPKGLLGAVSNEKGVRAGGDVPSR